MQIAATATGNPTIKVGIFFGIVFLTLFIVYRASSRNTSTAHYYAAGGGFSGPQNGIALAGDYLSAASFLGIAGAIAIEGYDGFLVAWLVALLLVAERVRNTSQYTMGDVVSYRMRQRPVRAPNPGPRCGWRA